MPRIAVIVNQTIKFLGWQLIYAVEKIFGLFIPPTKPIEDVNDFPWVKEVEKYADDICREYLQFINSGTVIPPFKELSEGQGKIVEGNEWRSLFLYLLGYEAKENIQQFPFTQRALKAIPGMTTAFFSVLEPHTHLTPHRGLYKGLLRYQMGLIIPQNSQLCGLKIDGTTLRWQPGSSLIFDDTYMHEAWNNADEPRVILFVDFKRKMPMPAHIINECMLWIIAHSPLVQNALKGLEKMQRQKSMAS